MKSLKYNLLLMLAFMVGCKSFSEKKESEKTPNMSTQVEVHGHRGDRGNYPENSIPAFKSAIKKGVEVLEMDVVISRDKKVVVSHEPYMASRYMLTPEGDSIGRGLQRQYNLYEMTYDSIRAFDSGSKGNGLFLQQKRMKTYKPLLAEVIDSVDAYVASEGLKPVKYNIELKSVPSQYGVTQPDPEVFIDLVMQVLEEKELEGVIIQSFDVNILNLMKQEYPDVPLSYLVSAPGIEENLALLDFVPEIYSPNYNLVKEAKFIDSVKTLDMKLVPWTVNKPEDIQRMIELEVDEIISDYPERVLERR